MYTIRPWLLVGKYTETLDSELLAASGARAMLRLAEAVPHLWNEDIGA
jgi:hypothetical protein